MINLRVIRRIVSNKYPKADVRNVYKAKMVTKINDKKKIHIF